MENKTMRQIKALAASVGVEIVSLRDTGSTHVLAVVQSADGRKGTIIFSGTPSCRCSWDAAKGNLRRFANNLISDDAKNSRKRFG